MSPIIDIAEENAFWVGLFSDPEKLFSNKKGNLAGIEYFLALKKEISRHPRVFFQIFNPDRIISRHHLRLILEHALQAFQVNTNISNQPEIEFLLYLALESQIQEAIKKVGVNFTQNPEHNISFGIIIFGKKDLLEKYVDQFLRTIQFTVKEFQPNLDIPFLDWITRYNISEKLIKNQFCLHQSNLEQFPPYDQLQVDFSKLARKDWIAIIESAVNQQMVLFSLNNLNG